MCAPRQQGAQRDTTWQVPGTGDSRRGGGGRFQGLEFSGGALAGAGAGADLWGLARDNVDTAEVAAEGRGWPQLYPQAWPRPILGPHLACLLSSGHPGVEVQPGCTWSDGAELPSAPHLARANVTVEKTRGWALGDSVFLQARGSGEQRLSRSPAGSEPSWPQADGLGRAGCRHEVGEADPGGVRTGGQGAQRSQPVAQLRPEDRAPAPRLQRGSLGPWVCLRTTGRVRTGKGAQQQRSPSALPGTRLELQPGAQARPQTGARNPHG